MNFEMFLSGFIRRTLALILLTTVLLVAGCGTQAKPEAAPQAPAAPPPTQVTAVKVVTKNVPIYIDQIGRCASPEIVAIKPQATGQILKIGFTEGADVKAGQPLFTIDPAPYQAALDQAKADVEINTATLKQTQATLDQYRAQLDGAKADLEQNQNRQVLNAAEWKRAQGLVGVIAASDYDAKKMAADAGDSQIRSNEAAIVRYQAQINQGLAAIEVAQAHIKSSQAAVLQAEINFKYTEIASPIDGRAGQRMVDKGNIVTAVSVMPETLLTVQRMDPIYAEFSIPERELPRVHAGMKAGTLNVECRIPDSPGEARVGKVFFVDNAVQEGTGTIRLRASIENKDRLFWPGQFVKIRLIFETRENATLIPASAAQLGQTGPFVFVVKPDMTAELRPVKLGLRYDDLVAIDEGLKSGETIVLKGQLMLQPGAKVAIDGDSKAAEKKDEPITMEKTDKIEKMEEKK